MAGKSGPDIIENGLLLYYDVANKKSYPGSGTSWYDLSGNENTITLTNGPTYNASNLGSILFDGTNDYGVASNSLLVHRNADWTYSGWLNFSSIPSAATIFSSGNWTNCLLFRLESGGVSVYSMAGLWGNFTFSPTIGSWYKVDFVRNGNTAYFYLNGLYKQSFGFSADVQPSSNFYVGYHAANEYFNGKIAQVSIYNRALSLQEINQNYDATKSRYGL